MISTETYPIREAKSSVCGTAAPGCDSSAVLGPRSSVAAQPSSVADLQSALDRREAQIRSLCLWLEAQRKELDYLIAQLKECC